MKLDRTADRFVVVDEMDECGFPADHAFALPRVGKVKWKAVPPWLAGFEPDPAAMRLDDRPADRKADAHAVLLGRDERLEQLRGDHIGCMPGPVSSMRDPD